MSELQYFEDPPSTREYMDLRLESGLSGKTFEAAELGLAGTYLAVTVRDQERLVGMGRVIGDGGCFFQVVDIAVHPDYQRRGIGQGIMSRLVAAIRDRVPASAYVSLIADGDANRLYEKFGFEPTAPRSIGMAIKL